MPQVAAQETIVNPYAEMTLEQLFAEVEAIVHEPVPTFTSLVTLVHLRNGDEKLLTVSTVTNGFADVMGEIRSQSRSLGLFGYEVFEILPV